MSPNVSNPHPQDVLQMAAGAARDGKLEELRGMLARHPDLPSTRDGDGDTLLGLQCRAATGDIAIPPVSGTAEQHAAVDLILQSGVDPNASTHDGWAPLHSAAMAGHVDLAQRLLGAGADRTGRLYGCQGGSPLALALFYAKTEVAEVLAAPAEPDNLRHAAALGRPIERFVDGAHLATRATVGLDFYRPLLLFPDWDRTLSQQEVLDEALTWASRNNQCDSMAALIELGADVNSNPYRGTALLWAIYGDRVAAASWLLDHGAEPDLKHDFGGAGHGVGATAMHLAAQYESIGCLKLLLARGADPEIRDDAHGGTARGWAEFSGAQASIDVLASYG